MQRRGHSPSRLTKYHNFLAISSELLDVLTDPLDGQLLIAESKVRMASLVFVHFESQEAESAESVVDRNDDHVHSFGDEFSIVQWRTS